MDHRPPAPAPDASEAAWIAPRLLDEFGAVCRTIPTGFQAYARVLHPADPGASVRRRWADIAEINGKTVHPLMQFARIAMPNGDRRIDHGSAAAQAPIPGDLGADDLQALCRVLERHSSGVERCWFALWEGWGEPVAAAWAGLGGVPPPPRPAPAQWPLDRRHAARFELPGRVYHLFTGTVDDALRFGHWVARDVFQARSPNMFWPDDRRWCVASEVDFDSTLVAGRDELVNDLVHSDEVEAWPVDPHDSLAWDGDTLNR